MRTDRRRLLQGAAAAGTGLALGGVAKRSAAAQGGQMEELRIAMQALPPQLDPQTAWIVMGRVYNMIFDTLIVQDWANGGALAPGLATEWVQVDETTLDVTLRQGVVFHDGTPLTPTDVKFTFDRFLQQESTATVFPIKEVTIVDDATVRFLTTEPRGGFLLQLAGYAGSIVPAAYFQEVGAEGFKMAPVGTGPYKVTEYVPDTHITFEVNASYVGPAPTAKKITLRGVPEVTTRVAALLNDEYDLVMDLPADQVPTVEEGGDFVISDVAPLNANVFAIVGTNAPLDKKEVRQALSLGINRQAIVEQLLGGYGVWPRGLQSELDPLYTERPQLPYDPEQAKQLLEQAGYAGEEIKLAFDSPNYYPLEREWTEVIVGMWSEIGLNVSMAPIDVNERVLIDTDDPWGLFTSSTLTLTDLVLQSTYADPKNYHQKLFAPGQFDEFNALVAEAQRTVDTEARKEITKQALDWLEDFTMILVLFTINRISAAKPGIAFKETPLFGIELRPDRLPVA